MARRSVRKRVRRIFIRTLRMHSIFLSTSDYLKIIWKIRDQVTINCYIFSKFRYTIQYMLEYKIGRMPGALWHIFSPLGAYIYIYVYADVCMLLAYLLCHL